MFECGVGDAKVAEQTDYAKSWEYREKNLAREALVINPAKACQPLGAVFAAAGFEKTMSFVHGSQGCVAYYRSHLSRHFKEPCSAVSSSMTEDAAVFGGLNNMVDGLANAYALYAPKMIAVSTTCMAEVIGDDLHSFIQTAKDKKSVPQDFDVPFAHTPGLRRQPRRRLRHDGQGHARALLEGRRAQAGRQDQHHPRLRRLLRRQQPRAEAHARRDGRRIHPPQRRFRPVRHALRRRVPHVRRRHQDRRRQGGAERQGDDLAAALEHAQDARIRRVRRPGDRVLPLSDGRQGDRRAPDEDLRAQSGKAIPESIRLERGRLVDAMADSQAYLHGKKYAIYGDPDFVTAMARFVHGDRRRADPLPRDQRHEALGGGIAPVLAASPFGKDAKIWAGKDLWHLRSLIFTEPVDMIIGNSYGKYLERDTGTPLLRLTFPIFDRHHHHRFPLWGYQGGLRVLTAILDKVFDKLDAETIVPGKTDYSYDLTR